MADKIYINQPVDIEIEVEVDGTDLTIGGPYTAKIEVRKPDKSEVELDASVVVGPPSKVTYSLSGLENDQAGRWLLQPVISSPAYAGVPGTTVEMDVSKRFT
jgi:hypothetical protein